MCMSKFWVSLFSTFELYIESSIYSVAFYRSNRYYNNIFPTTAGGIGGDWLCVWEFHPDKTGFIFLNICSAGFGPLPTKTAVRVYELQRNNLIFSLHSSSSSLFGKPPRY